MVTEPARRRSKLPFFLLVVGLLVAALVVWLVVSSGDPGEPDAGGTSPSGSSSASASPSTTGTAPPAPSSDQLKSGDWLLSSYSIKNDATSLWVEGKVANRGSTTSSAKLTVWLYVNGKSIGSVGTTVTDVGAGKTVAVTMRGDAKWQPGQKILLLQADAA